MKHVDMRQETYPCPRRSHGVPTEAEDFHGSLCLSMHGSLPENPVSGIGMARDTETGWARRRGVACYAPTILGPHVIIQNHHVADSSEGVFR